MNLNTVNQLCAVYDEFYDKIRRLDINTPLGNKWPVCRDPGAQHEAFLNYLKNTLPQDEWTEYYIRLSEAVHTILWLKQPDRKSDE